MALLRNEQVYPLYKPLRNALRKVELRDSLFVLWNYAVNLAFDRPIDRTCEVPKPFTATDRIQKQRMLAEWEIEMLVREVVINAPVGNGFSKDTFRTLSCLSRCVNKLKVLEEKVFGLHHEGSDMLVELHRIAHRQFVWTSYGPSRLLFLRYAKIYGHPGLKPLVERRFGLSVPDFYISGLALFSFYVKNTALKYPPQIREIPSLTVEMLDRVVEAFSLSLDDLRRDLLKEQRFSENFAYGYSPLRAYPLVRMAWLDGTPHLVCPMPLLLMWALTQGVYYRLVGEPGVAQALGDAFQSYVGEVLAVSRGGAVPCDVIPETEYTTGKGHQRTVDWLVTEPGAALFVECKAKRLRHEAKENIASLEEVHAELDGLAKAVVQVYKSIDQYERGLYPTLPPDRERRIYPLVVTMEEWYVMGGRMAGYLRDKVEEGLLRAGLAPERVAESPYTVCSVGELEMLVPVLRSVSIAAVMGPWASDPQYCQRRA